MAESVRTLSQTKSWMTLREVAELLGVHPSTVRMWADQGKLPAYRTPGGHRRFSREEVLAWVRMRRLNGHALEEVFPILLRKVREHLRRDGQKDASWYRKLRTPEAQEAYRRVGRQTAEALLQVLRPTAETDVDEAARLLGEEYATLARRYRLSPAEAVQALLFFRNLISESLRAALDDLAVQSPEVWSEIWRRSVAFADGMLVAMLEAYGRFEGRTSP